jgi:dihydroorotate dehydrogenase electron transfer subunit
MIQQVCQVLDLAHVAENIFVLSFSSQEIAREVLPGQFLNLRIEKVLEPFLRRPFSVYRAEGERVEIIFNVVGKGTDCLRAKRTGDTIDVLGPLGVPFRIDDPSYSTALLVGGGLGVAPLPLTSSHAKCVGKQIVTFLGARTSSQLIRTHLDSPIVATDDGSEGFHGNVAACLEQYLLDQRPERGKIFACGPTPMLRAVAALAVREGIACEVSLEGQMACGFGICQGCPVELVSGERRYALMCKDGPTFDVRAIRI